MVKRKRKLMAAVAGFLALLILAGVLLSVFASTGAMAAEATQEALNELRDEQDQLEARSRELEGLMESYEYETKAVLAKKQLRDEKVALKQQEIANIEAQILNIETQIADKEQELLDAEKAEAEQYELFKARVRAMEENSYVSYLEVIFDASSLSDLLGKVEMVNRVMEHDEQVVASYELAKETVTGLKTELESDKAYLLESKTTEESRKAELEQEIDDAIALIAELEGNVDEFTAAYEENEEAEKQLEKEIDDMVAELERIAEEKREEEAARAAAAAEAAARANAGSNASTSTPSASVSSTGTYVWPSAASKYVTSPFGNRFHPILKVWRNHNGIDIGASYGTNVLAADSGTVTIATYSSSYGNYIMINHGDGRYTLYAHMSTLKVEVGDNVSQGQTIGLVGSTGYSTGPHIHFEIIISGTRVNPLNYFTDYIEWWD